MMAEEEILSDFDLNLALQGLEMRGDATEMERIVNALGEQIKITREKYEICEKFWFYKLRFVRLRAVAIKTNVC